MPLIAGWPGSRAIPQSVGASFEKAAFNLVIQGSSRCGCLSLPWAFTPWSTTTVSSNTTAREVQAYRTLAVGLRVTGRLEHRHYPRGLHPSRGTSAGAGVPRGWTHHEHPAPRASGYGSRDRCRRFRHRRGLIRGSPIFSGTSGIDGRASRGGHMLQGTGYRKVDS